MLVLTSNVKALKFGFEDLVHVMESKICFTDEHGGQVREKSIQGSVSVTDQEEEQLEAPKVCIEQ